MYECNKYCRKNYSIYYIFQTDRKALLKENLMVVVVYICIYGYLIFQGGSVVNLTADVLSWVFSSPQLLWVPLSNSIQLENGVKVQNDGVAKFAGLSGHGTCVTFSNLSEETPTGHFEFNKIPLWTKNGKKMISSNRYLFKNY